MQPMIASDATVHHALSCRLDYPQLQPAGGLFAYVQNRPHGIADFVNTELHGVLAGGLNGGIGIDRGQPDVAMVGPQVHPQPSQILILGFELGLVLNSLRLWARS